MPNSFETDLISEVLTGEPAMRASKWRFGVFDLDLDNRELRKRGLRVKIQQKPLQILRLLIAQAGKFVSRAQLAKQLWPDLHVNFDRSLNTAMNSLRRALGDGPDNPRFIETRPGLGYRFIAPVEAIQELPDIRGIFSNAGDPAKSYSGAHHDYLRGRYFQDRMTEEDLGKSVAYFEAALATDPNSARACAGLADTYVLFAQLGIMAAKEAHTRAKEFAAAALRIDDSIAEAHLAMATVKRSQEWDWKGADAFYRRALALRPDYPHAHRLYAGYFSALDRHEESRQAMRRAQQLDPLSLVINADAAWHHYLARNYQDAMEQAWRTLALEPRFAPAQLALGLAYQQMGMLEEAVVELNNARVCSTNGAIAVAALANAYAAAGDRQRAQELLREVDEASASRHVPAYCFALMYSGLGDSSSAVRWLEQSAADRDVWLAWLGVEPRFDSLRAQGRLDGLLDTLRLNRRHAAY